MTTPKVNRVDVHADKLTIKTRVERAAKVAELAPTSTLYTSVPAVKTALDALVADGTALQNAEVQVTRDEAQASKSRAARDALLVAFDGTYDLSVATLEKHAAAPADLVGAGFADLQKAHYAVLPPLEVSATFDAAKGHVVIHLKHAPGMHSAYTEISPDPVGPATFKRLDGIGASHSLMGYAPGTYWVRVASVRGDQVSAWLGPVSVIVR